MFVTIKYVWAFLVPDSKILRRLCTIICVVCIAYVVGMEVYITYSEYASYYDPSDSYAYSSIAFMSSGDSRYGSTITLSLRGQNDWQSFADVATGDMVDIVAYYHNASMEEPQEAYMAIDLPSSLHYVQGSAKFQLAGSTEWRKLNEQSKIDDLFGKYVNFGSCSPGERIGVWFTVEMNPQEIADGEDIFASIWCRVAPKLRVSTVRSVVGVCHRTTNRVNNFFYWFTHRPATYYGQLAMAVCAITIFIMYSSLCINKE